MGRFWITSAREATRCMCTPARTPMPGPLQDPSCRCSLNMSFASRPPARGRCFGYHKAPDQLLERPPSYPFHPRNPLRPTRRLICREPIARARVLARLHERLDCFSQRASHVCSACQHHDQAPRRNNLEHLRWCNHVPRPHATHDPQRDHDPQASRDPHAGGHPCPHPRCAHRPSLLVDLPCAVARTRHRPTHLATPP